MLLENYRDLEETSRGPYPICYVVASTPRSATRYIATLLSQIGWACGHEQYFTIGETITSSTPTGVFGDSSWLGVPFLKRLPDTATLFHQIRNPVKTIASAVTGGNTGRFRNGMRNRPNFPWHAFAYDHSDDWDWPSRDPIEMECYFWWRWHKMIEEAKRVHQGPVYTYRIEDIGLNVLESMSRRIPTFLNRKLARNVLAQIPRTVNKREAPYSGLKRENLPEYVRDLAKDYGY